MLDAEKKTEKENSILVCIVIMIEMYCNNERDVL